LAGGRSVRDLGEVFAQQRQDNLRFGIAQPAIEFDHLRTVARQHQPGIEHPTVGQTTFAEGRDHWIDDERTELTRIRGHCPGRRRKCPHAARVWPDVAITDAFVVTGRHQWDRDVAVDQGEEGYLLALEELLD